LIDDGLIWLQLPDDEDEFFEHLHIYFPYLCDIKYMLRMYRLVD